MISSTTIFLKSINKSKQNVVNDDEVSYDDYIPFIINKCLSYYPDTLLLAEEMNMHSEIPKEYQYKFLLNMVRPAFRQFKSWVSPEKNEKLQHIMEYYKYNRDKASMICDLFTDEQIEFIKQQNERNNPA